jgi:integrase/recombinase XerD
MSLLAPTLQAFFTERLITQRDSSPQTVAAYRDKLGLLLSFAHERTDKQPCELDIDDLDAPLIGAFLTHLEHDRGNSARTRNARLGGDPLALAVHGATAPEHATSTSTRSKHCFEPRTGPPSSDGATTRCC